MQNQPLIELRQLTKTYQEGGREHIILRDINAVIQAGEFVVLLGRSGSGKSTFLNLLSGIDLPTSGEIAFNGIALNRLSEEERTRSMLGGDQCEIDSDEGRSFYIRACLEIPMRDTDRNRAGHLVRTSVRGGSGGVQLWATAERQTQAP